METKNPHKPVWLSILRWTARILAMLFVIFLLSMFIGESIQSTSHNTHLHWREYFFFGLMGITLIRFLIGLWREGLGGLISLVSTLIIFISLTLNGVNASFCFLILIPSILYLLSWYFHKTILVNEESSQAHPL